MPATDLLTGLCVAVGVVGIVVPVLPGSALIFLAVLAWTLLDRSATTWSVLALVTALLLAGGVVKYAVPGRRLRDRGVPPRSLLAGAVLAVVGFFVVPVVGLPLGFLLGVYLSELQRVGRERAWPATRAAVGAAGLSLLIELAAGLLAATTWLLGAVLG